MLHQKSKYEHEESTKYDENRKALRQLTDASSWHLDHVIKFKMTAQRRICGMNNSNNNIKIASRKKKKARLPSNEKLEQQLEKWQTECDANKTMERVRGRMKDIRAGFFIFSFHLRFFS